jgi:hypothetical protein
MTALTAASLATGYTRATEETVNVRRNQRYIRGALGTQFRPNLHGGLELSRQTQTSGLPNGDYVENVIAAFLLMKF